MTSVAGSSISYNQDGHRIGDAQYEYTLDALNRITRVRERATNAIARKSLAIEVDTSPPGLRVVVVLEPLAESRGLPASIT